MALPRIASITGQVLAWLVIGAALAALGTTVVVPRLAGATPYSVLTGSMRPSYPPGTLVVVKPVATDDLRSGDVVTYQLESGRSEVVTHRVVALTTNVAGETRFLTQGDANDVPDPALVRPVQVKGRLWYSVPYLGYVNKALSGAHHQVLVLGVAGGLLGYAFCMWGAALRDRLRVKELVTRG